MEKDLMVVSNHFLSESNDLILVGKDLTLVEKPYIMSVQGKKGKLTLSVEYSRKNGVWTTL